mmetsp:Transcript_62188/g.140096  ORF Transcript_62188/g.140096 Transcript_62188/m.140096 type:complete len:259 (-) Transcript_62188:2565-3341(-)
MTPALASTLRSIFLLSISLASSRSFINLAALAPSFSICASTAFDALLTSSRTNSSSFLPSMMSLTSSGVRTFSPWASPSSLAALICSSTNIFLFASISCASAASLASSASSASFIRVRSPLRLSRAFWTFFFFLTIASAFAFHCSLLFSVLSMNCFLRASGSYSWPELSVPPLSASLSLLLLSLQSCACCSWSSINSFSFTLSWASAFMVNSLFSLSQASCLKPLAAFRPVLWLLRSCMLFVFIRTLDSALTSSDFMM